VTKWADEVTAAPRCRALRTGERLAVGDVLALPTGRSEGQLVDAAEDPHLEPLAAATDTCQVGGLALPRRHDQHATVQMATAHGRQTGDSISSHPLVLVRCGTPRGNRTPNPLIRIYVVVDGSRYRSSVLDVCLDVEEERQKGRGRDSSA
jgi:hypothetical protein